MNNKDFATPSGIFISLFFFGITIAIYIQTGVSINPEDLLLDVGSSIIEKVGSQFTIYWVIFTILISIIGLITLISGLYLIYKQGVLSAIIAICGFVSGVTLLFKPTVYVGVFALIAGGFLVRYLE